MTIEVGLFEVGEARGDVGSREGRTRKEVGGIYGGDCRWVAKRECIFLGSFGTRPMQLSPTSFEIPTQLSATGFGLNYDILQ